MPGAACPIKWEVYLTRVRGQHHYACERTLLMVQDSLEKLKDALGVLVELELTIGEFYKTCAEQWSEDGVFWTEIYKQEHGHADYIQKMSEMISCSPENFILGRKCTPVAINTIISGIRKDIELVKANALSKIKALCIARDIEQSALESKIDELVKTDELGFLEITQKIVLQTKRHKEHFDKKIAELKAG